jgi:hypothetical protein
MELPFQFRPRQILEMDDLVATFVENELGRHDWSANWPAYKVKYPNYLDRIRAFFEQQGEKVNAEDVAKHIDQMIITRPGRWR